MSAAATHPLDMITGDEVSRAAACGARGRAVPDRRALRARPTRRADQGRARRACGGCGPSSDGSRRCVVPPDRLEADRGDRVGHQRARSARGPCSDGMRPALLFGESMHAIVGVKAHPDWQAALRRRGIERLRPRADRPVARGIVRRRARGRPPHQPLHLVPARVDDRQRVRAADRGRHRVLRPGRGARCSRSSTTAWCRCRRSAGSYLPDDVGPMRDDLKPLEITQPEGPSFTVDGNHVEWQRWSLRVGFDPYEGLDAAHVGYRRRRPRPAACCTGPRSREMVVPVRRPGADARLEERVRRRRVGPRPHGELADARLRLPRRHPLLRRDARHRAGEPYTIENAICMHEEDYGILWKHTDLHGGTDEVRRSRRLVDQLHRDGRQLRVRLLLVPLPRRQHPARGEAHRHRVAHGRRAGRATRVRAT